MPGNAAFNRQVAAFIILLVIVLLFVFARAAYPVIAGIHTAPTAGHPLPVTELPTLRPAATPTVPTLSPAAFRTTVPVPTNIPELAEDNSTGPGTRFTYTLRGKTGTISAVLDSRVFEYQKHREHPYVCTRPAKSFTGASTCSNDEFRDYYLQVLNEQVQKDGLDAFVDRIRARTKNPDDRVRIAISLVQHIPYDNSTRNLTDSKAQVHYPYETLYRNTGDCDDKSLLLAYILRDLGYGVSLFQFDEERHMAVGISSAGEFDYANTSYAFVETTTPTIATDYGRYDSGKYDFSVGHHIWPPRIIRISTGRSFDSVGEEYHDAVQLNNLVDQATMQSRLTGKGPALGGSQYAAWEGLVQKYGLKLQPSP